MSNDGPVYEQIKEIKKLRKVLTVMTKLMIHKGSPTVGSEILLQELDKIK